MKVWNYVVLTVGLIFLIQIAGIPMGLNYLLSNFGIVVAEDNTLTQILTNSSLYLAIFGSAGILVGIVAALVIGTFTRSSPENYIILPIITGTFVTYIGAFTGIINYAIGLDQTWITYIVAAIFIPLTVGFIISLVEFFRGTD